MAKCPPFHTDSEEYKPKHREVYHDDDECSEGEKIEKKHRKDGEGNRKRCEVCDDLESKRNKKRFIVIAQ
jgi:hypothetical protein